MFLSMALALIPFASKSFVPAFGLTNIEATPSFTAFATPSLKELISVYSALKSIFPFESMIPHKPSVVSYMDLLLYHQC